MLSQICGDKRRIKRRLSLPQAVFMKLKNEKNSELCPLGEGCYLSVSYVQVQYSHIRLCVSYILYVLYTHLRSTSVSR